MDWFQLQAPKKLKGKTKAYKSLTWQVYKHTGSQLLVKVCVFWPAHVSFAVWGAPNSRASFCLLWPNTLIVLHIKQLWIIQHLRHVEFLLLLGLVTVLIRENLLKTLGYLNNISVKHAYIEVIIKILPNVSFNPLIIKILYSVPIFIINFK